MKPIKLKTLVESFLLPYKDLEPLGWKKSVKEQLVQPPVAPGSPTTAPIKTMSADVTKKIENLTNQTNKINKDITNLDAKEAPMMKKKADLQKRKADLEKEKTKLGGVQENVNENSNDEMPTWAKSISEKLINIIGGFDAVEDQYLSSYHSIFIELAGRELTHIDVEPEGSIDDDEIYPPNNMKYTLSLVSGAIQNNNGQLKKSGLSLAEVMKYVKFYSK